MKELYKVLSIFLVISLVLASMPSDLFALRPTSYKLLTLESSYSRGYKPDMTLHQNHTIQARISDSLRQFVSNDVLSVKVEFNLLDMDTIRDFLEKHDIAMHNMDSVSILRLFASYIFIEKSCPKEHVKGVRIVLRII